MITRVPGNFLDDIFIESVKLPSSSGMRTSSSSIVGAERLGQFNRLETGRRLPDHFDLFAGQNHDKSPRRTISWSSAISTRILTNASDVGNKSPSRSRNGSRRHGDHQTSQQPDRQPLPAWSTIPPL